MGDDYRVSIFANPGPGCKPTEPMALVVVGSEGGVDPLSSQSEAEPILTPEGTTPLESQYCKPF